MDGERSDGEGLKLRVVSYEVGGCYFGVFSSLLYKKTPFTSHF